MGKEGRKERIREGGARDIVRDRETNTQTDTRQTEANRERETETVFCREDNSVLTHAAMMMSADRSHFHCPIKQTANSPAKTALRPPRANN